MAVPTTGQGELGEKFVQADGRKVRELREKKQWTQVHLSKESNVAERTIIDIEKDVKPNRRTKETVENLATCLGCADVSELIDYTIYPRPRFGQSVTARDLSPGEQLLLDACDGITTWLLDIAARLKKKHYDHILMYMLVGLTKRVRQMITLDWSPDHFHITMPSVYYEACLEGMSAARFGQGMLAVADMGDPIESFWRHNPDPDKTLIAERIFLAHSRDLLEPGALDHILTMLHRQREMYPIRIGVTSPGDQWAHPLGSNAVGRNMILLEPDLVGGYVKEGSKTRLKFASDASTYAQAHRAYEEQVSNSFEVVPGMTAEQIRHTFIAHADLGTWNPAWREPGDRSDEYYSKYDNNIRCWIKSYDAMIGQCSHLVQEEVMRLIRSPDQPLKLMEVGYGTGGLTRPLLKWCDELNAPCGRHRGVFIDEFLGIDSELQMQRRAQASHGTLGDKIAHLLVGNFDRHTLAAIAHDRKFDVICGSLVLHDILGVDPKETVDEFLDLCNLYLRPNGSVVFADIFMDAPGQEEQLRGHMRWAGLSEAQIEGFCTGNPEMIRTVIPGRLEESARKHGFRIHQMARVPGRGRATENPFKNIVLRKT